MISKKMCEQILDNSLTAYKKYMDGIYKGFRIIIDPRYQYYVVYIHATPSNDTGKALFEPFLEQHQKNMKYLTKAEVKEHYVKLKISNPKPRKTLPDVLNRIIDPILSQLLNCKYRTGCINCGDTKKQLECYEIYGYHHYLCDTCIQEIEASFQEKQQEIKSQKGKVVTGLVGAILGALLGVIAWVVLYNYEFFAWLAGYIIVMCAFKGYKMFGKYLDKKGVIISLIVIVAMVFLANHLSWAWTFFDSVKIKGYSNMEYFFVGKILKDYGMTTNYFIDLATGYCFTLLLGLSTIIKTFKGSIGSYSIKKM